MLHSMGYLDDLKRQAAALTAQRELDMAAFERHALATDAACKTVFHYWIDLARQLEVLQPPVPSRYVFDGKNVLDGVLDRLRFTDFRVDARRKRLADLEVYDHVVIMSWVRGGKRLSVTKDFPPDMERIEARLAQAGVVVLPDIERDVQTGRVRHARYDFEADVRVGVRLLPDHERGRLQFAVQNFEDLATLTIEFAAGDVDTALLDELSKWWLGEPQRFLAAGRVVKVVEPR